MKKGKYLQIFNYLLEFSKLRSKPIRDIEASSNYPEVIWMSNIPVDDKVDCIIHDTYSNESNYWLKISKPIEPEEPLFPRPPKNLEDWIVPESLLNRDELPSLNKEFIKDNGDTLSLEDFPEISKSYEKYIEEKWINDSDSYWIKKGIYDINYSAYDKVNTIYKKLFSIYNRSQQFGEEYELVMGVGLLNFKDNISGKVIRRHIITTPAEIQFEFSKRDSSIIISQNLENGLQIETDSIIDLFDSFDSRDIIEAETKAKEFIKEKELVNPFELEIHEVLQLLAERIKPGDGKYVEALIRPDIIPNRSTMFFSPAIILRKRDSKSFTSLYEKIIEDIKECDDIDIPPLNDLIDTGSPLSSGLNKVFNSELSDTATIYFPNKYNDEQKSIIIKARNNDKVLVQGPPGTGKSHTIANLICHLLASGKKVLVTAYTKRALEVLKDKLPEEFKSLAVNLLSGDSSSIRDLEVSVNKINEKLSNSDIATLQKDIDYYEYLLDELKQNREHDKEVLFQVKEKSSSVIKVNPVYQGLITEIAKRLEEEKSIYSCYKDEFIDYLDYEVINKISEFISLFERYQNVDSSLYNYSLPDSKSLFSIQEFEAFRQLHFLAERNKLSYDTCERIQYKNFDQLKVSLLDLKRICEEIKTNVHPYIKDITSDWSSHNSSIWKDKIEKSMPIFDELNKFDLKHIDRNVEIVYPEGKSLINLKNDATLLLDFLNNGNVLSGIGFKLKKAFLPSEIKEKLYFIENVRVNGSSCDTKVEFTKVIDDITIRQCFVELKDIWAHDDHSKLYDERLKSYLKLSEDTECLLELLSVAKNDISQIQGQSSVKINSLYLDEVELILENLHNNETLNQIQLYNIKRDAILQHLSSENIHPVSKSLILSISDFSLNDYKEIIERISTLEQDFENHRMFNNIRKQISALLPSLAEMIESSEFSRQDIPILQAAILHKHALSVIKEILSINSERELVEKIKSYDEREEGIIAKIASTKAWLSVLSNLTTNPNLRKHLEAWVQAIKRIGKTGTGKRALKFRKIAQEEMEHCKTSIPCWIMPLYKVAETIKPEKGIYDYAIIDEASQLGPDAIFLLYIAKNIIIVGDDKQTSPEYVGVDANAMTPFIEKHLQGIPFKNFYGTEYSFFDHAKRFCDGITVLREHFRCMPEIIEFSNKLFYAPEGKSLYPLKQYSENRLEPLMHVYCPGGYSEGQSSSIRNEPEAKAISNKVNEIVNDKRYDGKTIGVICLQGSAQSGVIETMLLKTIGESEYKKRKIICGNSASFQGDERDIILLSLVTARNHNRSALTRAEDERRFNVAVSRAIEQIWLFHSIQIEDLSNLNDLRYKLLDHFVNHKPIKPPTPMVFEVKPNSPLDPFESQLEIDVFNNIVSNGYSVKPKYEVAKGRYQIDLVVYSSNGTKIAIECSDDRWLGVDKYYSHIQKNKVLERCGWQFFKIRGGDYYINREESLEPLWNMLKVHEEIEEITKEVTYSPFSEGVSTLQNNREESDSNLEVYDLETDNASIHDQHTGVGNQSSSSSSIIRYFNLFESGTYVLTEEAPLKADYILPITANQKNGFLLQCYDSGHINKVNVSTLLRKRIDKEYMNGVNPENRLVNLTIIEEETIVGIFFRENGEKKFKAHYTEKISNRDALHLQGYKVMYSDFDKIEYKLLPMSIEDEIKRLIFNSFTAAGKAINNPYYKDEWAILSPFQ